MAVMAGNVNEDSEYAREDEPLPQMPQATSISASVGLRLSTLPRAVGHAAAVETTTQVPILIVYHSKCRSSSGSSCSATELAAGLVPCERFIVEVFQRHPTQAEIQQYRGAHACIRIHTLTSEQINLDFFRDHGYDHCRGYLFIIHQFEIF